VSSFLSFEMKTLYYRHDGANSRFSQLCDRTDNPVTASDHSVSLSHTQSLCCNTPDTNCPCNWASIQRLSYNKKFPRMVSDLRENRSNRKTCHFQYVRGISKIFWTDTVKIIKIKKYTCVKTAHIHPVTCNLAH
jgi:hypothetical protein